MASKDPAADLRRLVSSRTVEEAVLTSLLGRVSDRIFTQGKDAKNTRIGTYSEGYQKTRAKKGIVGGSNVILQFTQQMRNDFSVIVENANFGLGFTNSHNADKSRWVESTYGKEIFALTNEEQKLMVKLWEQEIQKRLG